MLRFLVSRFLQGIVVVFLTMVVTFVLLKQAPGGPYQRERASTPENEARLREQYGLDRPLPVQFFIVFGNALKGTLQCDKFKGQRVTDIIADSFPISVAFAVPALLIAIGLGVPIGAIAALRPGTIEDRTVMLFATLSICAPSLVLGPVIALIFGIKLKWFNVAGWYDADDWVLPALTLGLIYAGYVARLARGGLRETLALDFIRTARAKGVGEAAIVVRHALKLACLPLINFLGPTAAGMLTSSFITESVFQIPGLGQHFISAAINRDYALATVTAAFYAALIVAFNLLVDIIQATINPRIGLKS